MDEHATARDKKRHKAQHGMRVTGRSVLLHQQLEWARIRTLLKEGEDNGAPLVPAKVTKQRHGPKT